MQTNHYQRGNTKLAVAKVYTLCKFCE